uniref:Uncharacterized protein n=1 Tax=Setaria viridis TaxID=4556 RepID=A0A4U6VWG3_SETVI|nr:hypothetical protein SEVIR_2G299700v2 [Setaria viridis]
MATVCCNQRAKSKSSTTRRRESDVTRSSARPRPPRRPGSVETHQTNHVRAPTASCGVRTWRGGSWCPRRAIAAVRRKGPCR